MKILLHRNCQGFTLLELLIALVITAVVSLGVAATITQVFKLSNLDTQEMSLIRNLDAAGSFFVLDFNSAYTMPGTQILTTENNETISFRQSIDDPNDTPIIYELDSIGNLLRTRTEGGVPVVIAANVTEVNFQTGLPSTVSITGALNGTTVVRTYSMQSKVGSALNLYIANPSLGGGGTNGEYFEALVALGGTPPYSWSITSGALPNGLSLSAGTGEITGTPTVLGTFSFNIRVTDSAGKTASGSYSIQINPPPSITSVSPITSGEIGAIYGFQVGMTGGTSPFTWYISSGALPVGLTIDGDGYISGTPTGPAGDVTFTVAVGDTYGGLATKSLTIHIYQTITIDTVSMPSGTNGTAYSSTVLTSGGYGAKTWTLASGALPTGLTIGSSTGVISGTPMTSGTYSFGVRVTDTLMGTAVKDLSINVTTDPLVITTTSPLPDAIAGNVYTPVVLASTGGSGAKTWSISSGALPNGLTLNASTGSLSGTPTLANSYAFTARVTDGLGTIATKAFTIYVRIKVSPTTLPDAKQNKSYGPYVLTASGGTGPYTWAKISGAFPGTITLTSGGTISGTAGDNGTFTFTVEVTDSRGVTGTRILTINVTNTG